MSLHRAHARRVNRDSGVRRHHQPYAKLTGCLRRENPIDWNARPDPLPAKQHIDEQLAD